MHASKSNRPDKRFLTRTIKIQPRQRKRKFMSDTTVPEIKLQGMWLEELGFFEGKRIIIIPSRKKLVIRLSDY
jgi:toxic protein SymE